MYMNGILGVISFFSSRNPKLHINLQAGNSCDRPSFAEDTENWALGETYSGKAESDGSRYQCVEWIRGSLGTSLRAVTS